MDIQGYVNEVRALYANGQPTEHSFRLALAALFGSIEIRHYQKMIKILAETDRIMREIELPLDGIAKV